MKKLSDNSYKEIMKSVKPDYDKAGLWTAIDQQLDEKPKRKFLWIFTFGASLLLCIGIVGYSSLETKNYSLQEGQSNSASERPVSELREKRNTYSDKKTTNAVSSANLETKNIDNKNIDNNSLIGQTRKLSPYTKDESSTKENRSFSIQGSTQNILTTSNHIHNQTLVFNHSKPVQVNRLTSQQIERVVPSINLLQPIGSVMSGLVSMTSVIAPAIIEFTSFEFSIEPLSENQSKSYSLAFFLEGGRTMTNYDTPDKTTSEWADDFDRTTRDLYYNSLSLQLARKLNERLVFHTGISVTRNVTRFNTQTTSEAYALVPSDSASYYVYDDGSIEYFPGELTETTTETHTVQHYNHHYSLGLSLGLSYEWPLSERLAFYSSSSALYQPWNFSNGRGMSSQNKVVSISELKHSNSLLQLQGTAGVKHQWLNGIALSLGLVYRQDMGNYFLEKDLRSQRRFLGLETGLSIRL